MISNSDPCKNILNEMEFVGIKELGRDGARTLIGRHSRTSR